jgi:hypothetical protein
MAKTKAKKVYEVTIEGEYHAHTKDGNVLKPYSVSIKLGEEHKQAGFLSVFKNLVAGKVMKQKYPDYADGLYTHRLVKVVDLSDPESIPKDPSLMNLAQLTAFIQHNELPVQIGLYKDEDELRQAVIECLEDEEVFTQNQEKRKEVRGRDLELTNSLNELNPEFGLGLSTTAAEAEAANLNPARVPSADEVTLPEKPKTAIQTDEFNENILTGKDDDLGI